MQRIALAKLGWHTHVRIDKMGIRSSDPMDVRFGVTAKRNHWGHALSDVSFHDGVCINLSNAAHKDLAKQAIDTVYEGCIRAMNLWKDAVPCQTGKIDGKLVLAENKGETDYMRNFVGAVHPTENFWDDMGAYDGDRNFVEALCEIASDGLYVEDGLDHYFGRSRMARDCENRDWGYRFRTLPLIHNGEPVSFQPVETTTRLLSEVAVVAHARTSALSLRQYFEAAGPEMPAGFRSRANALAEQRKQVEESGLGPEFDM